ncbi:hypothetical protein IQ235_03585 [Oscillatoriales cyanobacterium LEGE 11467]|uniref:Uncharacterized protein n=1 Tax=Zarconia navalis LEGE 11467 TaxID=1828826 RepID=A0A928VW80_9CYAN|nr:hypothetical protein [Zarconia navalis]MBE9039872.1 hypothetical protein [Zarconia navalis LEGE 11467]
MLSQTIESLGDVNEGRLFVCDRRSERRGNFIGTIKPLSLKKRSSERTQNPENPIEMVQ